MESPEINPRVYSQLILTKAPRTHNRERIVVKLLEENKEKRLLDTRLGNHFLDETPKRQQNQK